MSFTSAEVVGALETVRRAVASGEDSWSGGASAGQKAEGSGAGAGVGQVADPCPEPPAEQSGRASVGTCWRPAVKMQHVPAFPTNPWEDRRSRRGRHRRLKVPRRRHGLRWGVRHEHSVADGFYRQYHSSLPKVIGPTTSFAATVDTADHGGAAAEDRRRDGGAVRPGIRGGRIPEKIPGEAWCAGWCGHTCTVPG